MKEENTFRTVREVTGLSIGWAVLMIAFGFLAVALPLAGGLGISILVAWLIVFGGFAHIAHAFSAMNAGSFIWRMLIGIVYVIGGGFLVFNPGLTLESLTLLMAAIFFAEGLLEIAGFFSFRHFTGAGWILFDGLVSLLLAYLIWRPWPLSSAWAIGVVLGINLMMSGFTLLMYSASARRALHVLA